MFKKFRSKYLGLLYGDNTYNQGFGAVLITGNKADEEEETKIATVAISFNGNVVIDWHDERAKEDDAAKERCFAAKKRLSFDFKESQKKTSGHFIVDLNYGWQRSDYDVFHSFELTDPADFSVSDEDMGAHLAELLDTTTDDEDFNWNMMGVAIPDMTAKKIQLAYFLETLKSMPPERAYEMYKLWWMFDNRISLGDLSREVSEVQYRDPEDSDYVSESHDVHFADWEASGGFGEDGWLSYKEFCERFLY